MSTCRLASLPTSWVISMFSRLAELDLLQRWLSWVAVLFLCTFQKYPEYRRLQTGLQMLSISELTAVRVIKFSRVEIYPSVSVKLHADQQWGREKSCKKQMDKSPTESPGVLSTIIVVPSSLYRKGILTFFTNGVTPDKCPRHFLGYERQEGSVTSLAVVKICLSHSVLGEVAAFAGLIPFVSKFQWLKSYEISPAVAWAQGHLSASSSSCFCYFICFLYSI